MKILQSIRQTWKRLREQYHASRHQKRVRYLVNLSCENIVSADDLKGKAPDILAQAREDYLAWKEKFNA